VTSADDRASPADSAASVRALARYFLGLGTWGFGGPGVRGFGGLPWMQGAFYGVGAAMIAIIG
jgi:chromate transport protein ChrA